MGVMWVGRFVQHQIFWAFYLEPVTVEQFGFACPKVMFPSSNWDVLEAASVFSKGFQLGSVASLAFDDSAGRIRANDTGPFLMFVRTMLLQKLFLQIYCR